MSDRYKWMIWGGLWLVLLAVIFAIHGFGSASTPVDRAIVRVRLADPYGLWGYQWYSDSEILAFSSRDECKPFLMDTNGVRHQDLDWLQECLLKVGVRVLTWGITSSNSTLAVIVRTSRDTINYGNIDLVNKQVTFGEASLTNGYGDIFVPARGVWVAHGSRGMQSAFFQISPTGTVESVSFSPAAAANLVGARGERIYLVREIEAEYVDTLTIDVVKVQPSMQIEDTFTLKLGLNLCLTTVTVSPDGEHVLVGGLIPDGWGLPKFSAEPPFVMPQRKRKAVFLCVSMRGGPSHMFYTKPGRGYETDELMPRWLPNGKSVSIVEDKELLILNPF